MRATGMARAGILLALATALGACSSGGPPKTMYLQRGVNTPDEFSIVPTKPLETPPNYRDLPPPTPFGANRTDATPEADAVAALGGNPARLQRDGRSPDGALVQYAGRYGIDPNVRPELALADYRLRQKNQGRLLERWFQVTTYYQAYRDQELNQEATKQYYSRAGVPTPSAPPPIGD